VPGPESRSTSSSVTNAAQVFGCSRNSLRPWAQRFLTAGRNGLADRGRRGRPPKLDAAAREGPETALAARQARCELEAGDPARAVQLLAGNVTNSSCREAQFGNVSRVISPPDGRTVALRGRQSAVLPAPVAYTNVTVPTLRPVWSSVVAVSL